MPTKTGISTILSQVSAVGRFGIIGSGGRTAARRASPILPRTAPTLPRVPDAHPARRVRTSRAVQPRVKALGKRARDAGNPREVLDARRLHLAQAPEVHEQRAAALGSDTVDLLERRRRARLAAPRAMPLDREAMRFVADLLQEVQPWVIGRQEPLRSEYV